MIFAFFKIRDKILLYICPTVSINYYIGETKDSTCIRHMTFCNTFSFRRMRSEILGSTIHPGFFIPASITLIGIVQAAISRNSHDGLAHVRTVVWPAINNNWSVGFTSARGRSSDNHAKPDISECRRNFDQCARVRREEGRRLRLLFNLSN